MLVLLQPSLVTGRGPSPDAGWRITVTGADDTAMVFDLVGPDRETEAATMFDLVGNFMTRDHLAALGFTLE